MTISPAFKSALDAVQNETVTGREKGLPAGAWRLGDLGRPGWNILRGDVPLPAMVIRWMDVEHNIRLMQDYCDRHGAWLAPHGKTTMAPQIFAAQLASGSWSITLANIPQLQVARSFGLDRVLLANEAINDYDARFLAREMAAHPAFEPYVLVDSAEAVARLAGALERDDPGRPLNVFVELGMPGGRCGIRTVDEAKALAEIVLSNGRLRLAGVEGYEGIAPGATHDQAAGGAAAFLKRLAETARAIRPLPAPDETRLAIVSMGKRDVPIDLDMPVPLYWSRAGAAALPLGPGFQVFRVNDQLAYLRLVHGSDLQVGDVVGCGISHPCTAFDKWRVLLTIDEERDVTGGVRTYF